jgi:hypothetical protein
LSREGAWIPGLRCAAAFDVAIMALIYALKYQEDVRRGKAKDDGNDRWWGMM